MGIAEKLEALRQARGISARELARQVKLKSDSSLQRWLNGESEPRVSDAVKLADYFGVSLDELAGRGRAPGGESLSPEDRVILDVIRALGLTKDVVIRRLYGPAQYEPGFVAEAKGKLIDGGVRGG